jgi:hypothetical protein
VAYLGQDANKIDSAETDGLLGVHNSLAYRVHEIEKHFHSEECWFGTDGDDTGSTANNMEEWEITAGSGGAYGTEVQLLGANDINDGDFSVTPVKFDMHRIFVTVSSASDKNYIIQLWHGASTFGAATIATTIPYRAAAASVESQPIAIMMGRIPVENKIWARIKCETDSATLEIIVGIHVYAG